MREGRSGPCPRARRRRRFRLGARRSSDGSVGGYGEQRRRGPLHRQRATSTEALRRQERPRGISASAGRSVRGWRKMAVDPAHRDTGGGGGGAGGGDRWRCSHGPPKKSPRWQPVRRRPGPSPFLPSASNADAGSRFSHPRTPPPASPLAHHHRYQYNHACRRRSSRHARRGLGLPDHPGPQPHPRDPPGCRYESPDLPAALPPPATCQLLIDRCVCRRSCASPRSR